MVAGIVLVVLDGASEAFPSGEEAGEGAGRRSSTRPASTAHFFSPLFANDYVVQPLCKRRAAA